MKGVKVQKRKGTAQQMLQDPAQQANMPGMMRYYTDDSPGLNVQPASLLIASGIFIACVIVLHLASKFIIGH